MQLAKRVIINTDIIRYWDKIEKPKFIDFYNEFKKDMDELIDIGKFPVIFRFPEEKEKLLSKLIEDNKNGIFVDSKYGN